MKPVFTTVLWLALTGSALAAPSFAADLKVSAMTAASALSGPELFYCSQSSGTVQATLDVTGYYE